MFDFAVVGGGIIGLSVGMAIMKRSPDLKIAIIEKEDYWAAHQTGHNSGVIHSGLYYKPGSYKARFAIEGNHLIPEFCRQHGIVHDICGKIIVATEEWELPLLHNLAQRGFTHGLPVRKIGPEEIREIEPHCAGVAGVEIKSTGITDYKKIAAAFATIIHDQGGTLRLGCKAVRFIHHPDGITIETNDEEFHTNFLVNCAGLHSDRVAKLDNVDTQVKIVPFRGEYYELKPEKRFLVNNLIYPVPNPDFPFLGVHFTRMVDGNIHCGPNAVLALKREGYTWKDINLMDAWDTFSYGGFWKLVSNNLNEGLKEIYRSISKRAFAKSLQRLIPEVQEGDLIPSHAGVRAQALMPDGKLVDDFLIIHGERSVHVCNAPSPAATASIPIGRTIAEQLPLPGRTFIRTV
ncbi:MAG TPA: L-2-hydroxyglutarate oxidase [Nitrospirota bacterium]|nr:L-2-hydroxyglutarate oxidase [Nitrospirota bacterium]